MKRLVTGALGALLALVLAGTLPSAAGAYSATVTSFDGTPIHVNFLPAAGSAAGRRAPTVMLAPGWTARGDDSPYSQSNPVTGIPGAGVFVAAGFNVVSWDPRGFGQSGGLVEFNSPQYEGRDVSAIISWLARQRLALLDGRNDPRVGMAGGSYGGGIQLVAAALDHRIDAIAPSGAYNSLITAFDPGGVPKTPWIGDLAASGQIEGRLDPLIAASYETTLAGAPFTQAEYDFWDARGPGALVRQIRAPTLIIQGTVDGLFPPSQSIANYELLRRAGVPVKMLWICGGHGLCLTNPGDLQLFNEDIVAWFYRYLRRDTAQSTGPAFEWVDQAGSEHVASDYPLAAGGAISAHGTGFLAVGPNGGAGPIAAPAGASPSQLIVAAVTPGPARDAVNLALPAVRRTVEIAGPPSLTITYRGLAQTGSITRTHVFAQFIDSANGHVLDNQITPVPVSLDGASHTLTVPLETLAAIDRPGETLTLQLTPSTADLQAQHAAGVIGFTDIGVSVPTIATGHRPPGYGSIGPDGCTGNGLVTVRFPPGTTNAQAYLGKRSLARGGSSLRIALAGLGARWVHVLVVARAASGLSLRETRTYRACR